MSTAQSNAAALPPEEAYAVVHQRVYAPVFRAKLASYGIVPADDTELATMIEMAGELREAYEINRQKQATAQGSVLGAARKHLSNELEKRGFAKRASVAEEAQRKQACAKGALDQQLAHAILSMQLARTTNETAAA